MEPLNRPKFFRLATLKGGKAEASGKSLTKNKGTFKSLVAFFSRLDKALKSKAVSKKEFEDNFSQNDSYTLDEFYRKIREFYEKASENEVELIFSTTTSGELLNKEDFIKAFRKKYDENDSSSESEDISSASDAEYVQEDIDTEKVNSTFELIFFRLRSEKITHEAFAEIASKHFGSFVTSEKLTKFLLSKDLRIEDGPERNMLMSFILEDCSRVPLNKFLAIFEEKSLLNEVKDFPIATLENVRGGIINACKKFDSRKSGYVTWEQLEGVMKDLNVEITKDLKYYCFALRKSLDMIPYPLI